MATAPSAAERSELPRQVRPRLASATPRGPLAVCQEGGGQPSAPARPRRSLRARAQPGARV
eukprot:2194195-Alexandrium_andersonii.AAC.1